MNCFILPYLGQISQLKNKIARLKKEKNWYKQNMNVMEEVLQSHGIQYSMNFQKPEFQEDEDKEDKKSKKAQTVIDHFNNDILNELVQICFKKTNKVEYSLGFKAFTYSLYCSSELCYRSLRSKLPFPSESCLRKTFQNPLNLLKKQLSSIENVRELLINRSSKFEEASVRCTLSIDAFSITTITPYCKKRYIDGDKNNCFLFLIIPLEKNTKFFQFFYIKVQMECQMN